MKWIGQNIYDQVSRFRNDIYLEDISTGTIASGAHLGLDSNNKIVKAVDGGGDLTAIVAGTGLSGTDLTGPIPTLNVDASQTQITAVGTITTGVWNGTAITADYIAAAQTNITSLGTLTALQVDNININANTITASSDLTLDVTGDIDIDAGGEEVTVDSDVFTFLSGVSNKPIVRIRKTGDDTTAPEFRFQKDKGAVGVDGDDIGVINFVSDDTAQTQTTFARILAEVSEADNTDEAGKLTLSVAESDGTTTALTAGLVIEGEHATDGQVDVTIAAGAASTTTVAGNLVVTGTAISSPGRLRLNPASGSDILFDGGISLDADVIENIGTLKVNGIGGTIELGHASDTTLARSAAGKVTIEGETVITASTAAPASGAQAPLGMQIARRTITTAEANSLHSTPIQIIPAQGSNTVIQLVLSTFRIDRAATQTNSLVDLNFHYDGKEPGAFGSTSLIHVRRFMHNITTDISMSPPPISFTSGLTLTESVNKGVFISFDAASTTNCFTSIDVYVTYYVINIS